MAKTKEISISISSVNPFQTQWVRFSIKKEVGERETVEQASLEGLNEVNYFFSQHFKDYIHDTVVINTKPEDKKTMEEKFLELIKTATSIKELESYKLLSSKYPKLQEAYNNRLKQLTNV